ncbi:M18 family aminopeptidase [Pelagibaculum spongiae]|uniref:M18 family aminopeptidase n=1 Tax=Pelagibaculum spongiae TaxID=2080658 RepID=A0A2V1GZG0_9GAMM|nr:M18 family aminopeptidase [Pelagibaculum spongiae]PVZ72434.1 M18 family aminopeptidase [Pelagibaculum spongiae]
MNSQAAVQDLLTYLESSPTPFHATLELTKRLDAAGFRPLNERDEWALKPGDACYITRNDSSIIAFKTGNNSWPTPWKLVGAHTDSPCLKVKPEPELLKNGYFQLGVEVYGGALLNPWFDRDLSLAGRVSWQDNQGQLQHSLVDFKKPVAMIPSLAIHLDREANKNRTINPQTDIPPILMTASDKPDFRSMLKDLLLAQGDQAEKVLDFEICAYDVQPPALVGFNQEFLASARLDNLLSCHAGLTALLESDGSQPVMLVCNDHEEIGSQSACGAQGPFLRSVLERIVGGREMLERCLPDSLLISADNAHAVHPNFASKHDGNHLPTMGGGPVIKINANHRYATTSITSAQFRQLCEKAQVPVQTFVARTDMGCGSTIGPLTEGELGLPVLDVGMPQFAMHSVRETCAVEDVVSMVKALKVFFA